MSESDSNVLSESPLLVPNASLSHQERQHYTMECSEHDVHAVCGAGEGSPPTLPAKQRRSIPSRGLSHNSNLDQGDWYPGVLMSPTATDCQAPLCPIHQISGHHERFLSDSTPPPLPKKRVMRTMSLPIGTLSAQCLLRSTHLHFENPLYMLVPIGGVRKSKGENEQAVFKRADQPEHPGLPSFDQPDSWLLRFFRNFHDQKQVALDIQDCCSLFLKNVAKHLEASILKHVFLEGAEHLQPEDFVLCKGQQAEGAETISYRVHCLKFPGRVFAAKVWNSITRHVPLPPPVHLMPHPNIQQTIIHFPSTLASGEKLESQEVPIQSFSSEVEGQQPAPGKSLVSLLSEGCEVAILTEFPMQTLKDFVEEGSSFHHCNPEAYERQVLLLLLQVVQGFLHLQNHTQACTELLPQCIGLIWPGVNGQEGKPEDNKESKEASLEESIQMSWQKWGAPRIVVTPVQTLSQPGVPAMPEEAQLADLMQYCLHKPQLHHGDPGLLRLATLLRQGELDLPGTPAVLQALIWGPARGFQEPSARNNWLWVKRTLLMLKLAERGLGDRERRLSWEDYLCLQYYCLTEPETIAKTATLLQTAYSSF